MQLRAARLLISLYTVLVVACDGGDSRPLGPEPPLVSAPVAEAEHATVIACLGDSITAGFQLPVSDAYPARLEKLLRTKGHDVRVVNAGVSGDTTAGGLRRLPWVLEQLPDLLLVELGANDGLRGLPLADTESNLNEIIDLGIAAGSRVIVAGMRIPPSYGPVYSRGFAEIYPRVAARPEVELVPFILEGVAGVPELNLEDGIHPTAAGHEVIAAALLPYLEEILVGE